MMEVGWSCVISNGGIGVGGELDLFEGEEGEIVVLEPQYYMEYIRNLLGEVKFWSVREGEEIVIYCRGEDEIFCGRGEDREIAFMRLLGSVGEWYWVENCPSIGNLRGSEIGGMGGGSDSYEFEMLVEGGRNRIIFREHWVGRMVMHRWSRYILESLDVGVMKDMVYHGRMKFLEGDFEIWTPVDMISLQSYSGNYGVSGLSGNVWGGYSGGSYNPGVGMDFSEDDLNRLMEQMSKENGN
jgi:hypothetical protein